MIDLVTIIPHCKDIDRYGEYLNDSMVLVRDWVMFIDSDAMLLHPNWYDIIEYHINNVGHRAGYICCGANRTSGIQQRWTKEKTDCINWHTEFSIDIYNKNKGVLEDVTDSKARSGNVLITHRKAWLLSGGFSKGFLGVDTTYCRAVKKVGYKVYLMKDFYIYHRYSRYWKNDEKN